MRIASRYYFGDDWRERSGYTGDPAKLQPGEIVGRKNRIIDNWERWISPATAAQRQATTTTNVPNGVYAVRAGVVTALGWSNPDVHTGIDAGLGWRIRIGQDDGFYDQCAHLDPTFTLALNTSVNARVKK
jgi:murein DD-endopeptidase MepM/ murein hydrolase activator NlpD